jgi:tetratricopeptide (TPR) repeat protein
LEEGIQLYKEKDYHSAIAFFENFLTKYPNHSKAIDWLEKIKKEKNEKAQKFYEDGLILYTQEDRTGAVREWQKALELNPDHERAKKALEKIKEDNP